MRWFGLALVILLTISLVFSQDSSQDENPLGTPEETTTEPSEETTAEPSSDNAAEVDESLLPTITIKRKDRTIRVVNYAPDEAGGASKLNIKSCDPDDEELRTTTFYAPGDYLVKTYVNDTLITSHIAFSKRPPNKRDEEGNVIEEGGEKTKLELYGGTLNLNDIFCPVDIKPSNEVDVKIIQGRTTIDGTKFTYDNNKGLGDLDGPVTLDRIAEGESPALKANSDKLEFNVDTDQKILTGNVKIESEDRVSEAERLEYDEENSIAVLYGNPAKSTKGEDTLEGNIIIYYLDKNDVVIKGNIQGTVNVDLGNDAASGGSSDETAEPPAEDPPLEEDQ
jgi:lipopolysaccharide export system protein LptA